MSTNPVSNAPEDIASPSQFLAVVSEGFATGCRFAVRINIPRILLNPKNSSVTTILRELTFLCEAAEFTGRGFETVDDRLYGPAQKKPTVTQYNDLNLVFMCRSKMKEKQF